ncbi:MAG: tRNA (guanosine(46)-N7)-methyltransferase TrmB [Phycisphaerae bacterium]|nr:tRNA (guanosine(46)-N7)-methyltransferase TrmB [Phycisphaerae bacterium]NUQ47024.1 tRNA (guanosine(46)-N7)-methyltransferase TrmB [Phycisphaerae bacterium]
MLTLTDIAVATEAIGDRADLAALFGRAAPTELEIGCGKGGFLLRQARAHPERNYLGIEWANKFHRFAADRMARWGLTNVRLLRTDARHFVIHRLPVGCLAALHVYHPDPWPKKRHHKRRLFNAAFVDAAARALAQGGRLAVQTDHAGYFEVIVNLASAHPMLAPAPFVDDEFGTANERTETNYEIKYEREGRPIFRAAWRRR